MLKIQDLNTKKEDNGILKDINLKIENGEGVVVFGPNGGGKSTLFKSIIGVGELDSSGSIELEGKDLLGMDIEERVRAGIGYMYQTAPVVKGVELSTLTVAMEGGEDVDEVYAEVKEDLKGLDVEYLYDREVNVGLSGGEVKRSELFTLSLLKDVKLYLFDEPDSGVDIENVKRLGKFIKEMVEDRAYMIITHSGEILKYLNPSKGVVVIHGEIVHIGDPKEILEEVIKNGYSQFGKEDK